MLVKWSGDDGEIGAGIAVYDVLVSENGGRYQAWLQNTQLIEAEYFMPRASQFEFVTLAKDNVGNLEEVLKLPDWQRPTAFAGGPYAAKEGVAVTLSGAGSAPESNQTLTYEWDFDYDGTTFEVDSTVQSPQIAFGDGPSHRTVGLRVRQSGASSIASSVSIATVSVDNVAPTVSVDTAEVRGFAFTTLRNTGTWRDVPDDAVTVSASVGTVEKNADDKWNWSFTPTSELNNQAVIVTAKDKDGAESSVSFSIFAAINTETFLANISSPEPAITGNRTIKVALDFGGPVVGFSSEDLEISNAALDKVTDLGSGKFELELEAVLEGAVTIALKAAAVTDVQGRFNVRSPVLTWNYVDTANTDFGDAPSASQSGFSTSYPTLLAQDGARHRLGELRLGTSLDAETNGTPMLGAAGDDSAGTADEDGVEFSMLVLAANNATTISSVNVKASGTGKVDAWIDFNRDGDWSDPGEQILASATVNSGANLLPFTVPAGAVPGVSYARFRLSSVGGLAFTGPAADGEVEDHAVTITGGANQVQLSLAASILGPHELLVVDDMLVVRSSGSKLFSAILASVGSVTLDDGLNGVYQVDRPSSSLFGVLTYAGPGLPVRIAATSPSIDLAATAGNLRGVTEIDLTGNGAQQLKLAPADIDALNASKAIKVIIDRDDRLDVAPMWKLDHSKLENGKPVHTYRLGTTQLEVANFFGWQNLVNSLDVNGNGSVEPLDALLVINHINVTSGSGKLPTFDPANPQSFSFVDVNGNDIVQPLDVLLIINYLNTRAVGGNGEASPADFSESADLTPELPFLSTPEDTDEFASSRFRSVDTVFAADLYHDCDAGLEWDYVMHRNYRTGRSRFPIRAQRG